jgi:protein-L-isoaspartate(D-aspartate) O-methyltransferase
VFGEDFKVKASHRIFLKNFINFVYPEKLALLRQNSMLEDGYKERGLRNKLVKVLENKGITDKRVLAAIAKVPRHFFFENALLDHAYQDKAFPIGEGQTISQPYTVAFQTEKLEVKTGDKVLEIGTGSGYQACVLLELGARVYTIEYNKVLFEQTRDFLPRMGYRPYFFHGDGSKGLPQKAPFDKIIVTAGAPIVPDPLLDQLADGGILVIPVGDREKQVMLRIKRIGDRFIKEEFPNFAFVPLLGEKGWQG